VQTAPGPAAEPDRQPLPADAPDLVAELAEAEKKDDDRSRRREQQI